MDRGVGTVCLVIPRPLPSKNTLRRRPPDGDGLGRELNTAWRRFFERELPPLRRSARCRVRSRLEIVRVMGPRDRAYDTPNAVAGANPLIDALVTRGYLADDKPALLELVLPIAQVRGTGARILITITRLEV